jgi:uncharacterized protein (DUF58 family)
VFAFSAVQNSDRVGLLLFSSTTREFIPPHRGRAHAQVLVRAAVDAAIRGCSGAADIGAAVRFLDRVAVKRSVVIVVSDFLDVDFDGPLRRLNRRHDVVAITITDPRERRFPAGGLVRLVDDETGEARLIDLRRSDVVRRAEFRDRDLERRFTASAVDHLEVSTAIPYDRELLRFFKERVKRRR